MKSPNFVIFVSDDLGEPVDLAGQYPELVNKLQAALREWEEDVDE